MAIGARPLLVAFNVELAFARAVEHAEFERFDAEFARHQIHRRLGGEHALNIARRAHEAAGHGVRIHRRALEALVGNTVGELRLRPRQDRRYHLTGGIRAAVKERVHVQGDHFALFAHAGANGDFRGMADIGRADVVDVVAHELHRTSGGGRKIIARELFDREPFRAEVAADIAWMHHELLLRQAGGHGKLFA